MEGAKDGACVMLGGSLGRPDGLIETDGGTDGSSVIDGVKEGI